MSLDAWSNQFYNWASKYCSEKHLLFSLLKNKNVTNYPANLFDSQAYSIKVCQPDHEPTKYMFRCHQVNLTNLLLSDDQKLTPKLIGDKLGVEF